MRATVCALCAKEHGATKRIFRCMSPRETRVVALNNPSDRENAGWYFQRWVPHLPVAEEFVLFNRSWYNRAGVEPVMGFCPGCQVVDPISQVRRRTGLGTEIGSDNLHRQSGA